ncbi:MAG: hypothetical protein HC879_15760 [Leptolyngbyaceae cyanobacterium SL_5_9]|nr:hypothetical protein [Leptolyngbyaceae cyanobacterium SL_5_9]NJO75864.1 hypothetical protein [Leptolyngbyaceae cyanobacterium RM1_406_9]
MIDGSAGKQLLPIMDISLPAFPREAAMRKVSAASELRAQRPAPATQV